MFKVIFDLVVGLSVSHVVSAAVFKTLPAVPTTSQFVKTLIASVAISSVTASVVTNQFYNQVEEYRQLYKKNLKGDFKEAVSNG